MPHETAIPDDVRALLRAHVHSLEELEILLLLHAEPTRTFDLKELAARLPAHPELDGALDRLVTASLVRCVKAAGSATQFCYRPETPELAKQVEGLAEAYRYSRTEILIQIAREAIERVRLDALKTFAEAFRIKWGKNDS